MESLSRWASRARLAALAVCLGVGLLAAAPMLTVLPAAHVMWLTFASVGLIGGYALHLTIGRPVARRLVAARAARLASRSVDRATVEAYARAFVV